MNTNLVEAFKAMIKENFVENESKFKKATSKAAVLTMVCEWVDSTLVPLVEEAAYTTLQIKDRLQSKNNLLVSIPVEGTEGPRFSDIQRKIHAIVDNPRMIQKDLAIGVTKVGEFSRNKKGKSKFNNYRVELPPRDVAVIKNNEPIIKTLFDNLKNGINNDEVGDWKIMSEVPAYTRLHRSKLNKIAFNIRKDSQTKTSTKIKWNGKMNMHELFIKNDRTDGDWVNMVDCNGQIESNFVREFNKINPKDLYLPIESEAFYSAYKNIREELKNKRDGENAK